VERRCACGECSATLPPLSPHLSPRVVLWQISRQHCKEQEVLYLQHERQTEKEAAREEREQVWVDIYDEWEARRDAVIADCRRHYGVLQYCRCLNLEGRPLKAQNFPLRGLNEEGLP